MKEEILRLRLLGKTYNEIKELTGASKATINYHCTKNNLNDRTDGKGLKGKDIVEIQEYYKNHTLKETTEKFNVGFWSVKKITENKNKKISEDEKKIINYNHVKSFRKKNKERSIEYKGGKCQICGYNKCNSALEFHHPNPENKEFSPSRNMNLSWDKLKLEIEKCILVCANCHREIHERIISL